MTSEQRKQQTRQERREHILDAVCAFGIMAFLTLVFLAGACLGYALEVMM